MSELNDTIESFNINEIQKILRALSNEDAIQIFLAAKKGIMKSTDTIKKLKLTQRRYYARLNELIECGLIEKRDDVYELTTLGIICYNLGEFFNTTIANRDRLDLADRLRKAKSISLDETKQILQAITNKGIVGSLGVADLIHPVKMIETYEQLVSEIVSQIDKAEKNVYLASYYFDPRGVNAILRAVERGLTLSFLSSTKRSLTEKLQVLRLILNPNIIKLYTTFFDKKIHVKLADFPFSFCVIDEKHVIIELPNPLNNSFYLGFSLENEALSRNLIETFEALSKEGKEHPIINQFKNKIFLEKSTKLAHLLVT